MPKVLHNGLPKSSLTEIKSLGAPPMDVIKVILATMMVVHGKDSNELECSNLYTADRMAWRRLKALLSDPSLVKQSVEVADTPDDIPEKVIQELQTLLPEIAADGINKKSRAAADFLAWVKKVIAQRKS